MTPVTAFAGKPVASADKVRGGYDTPEPMARFLARLVREAGPRIVEPAPVDTENLFTWLDAAAPGGWDGVAGNPPYIRFGTGHPASANRRWS